MQEIYITKSADETSELGRKIASDFKGGDLVLLYGDLGAGKTQFTKGIAKTLGITETVTSPTFTIERIYPGKKYSLHHLDLYRTVEDREVEAQIMELVGSPHDVTVIEWPENLLSLSSLDHYSLKFENLDDDTRKIVVSKRGDRWS